MDLAEIWPRFLAGKGRPSTQPSPQPIVVLSGFGGEVKHKKI